MHLKELKKLISKVGSDFLEFKNTTGPRSQATKTVCALLKGQCKGLLKSLTVDYSDINWNQNKINQ